MERSLIYKTTDNTCILPVDTFQQTLNNTSNFSQIFINILLVFFLLVTVPNSTEAANVQKYQGTTLETIIHYTPRTPTKPHFRSPGEEGPHIRAGNHLLDPLPENGKWPGRRISDQCDTVCNPQGQSHAPQCLQLSGLHHTQTEATEFV